MGNKYNGIIPYGSGDASVLFECSCTDEAEIATKNGTIQSGASISSAGVKVGAAGGIQFDLTGLDATIKAQMEYTGHVSFDVKAEYWGSDRPVERNTAKDWAATGYFLHWNSADDGSSPYGSCAISSANAILGYTSLANETVLSNTDFRSHVAIGEGNDGYVTVTITWNGARTQLYYNGVLDDTESRTAYTSGIFEYLMVGALLTSASPLIDGVIRNVVMSYRPVQFATHPMLSNVACYGDSFFANSTATAAYGAGTYNSFESYFRRMGFKCNIIEGAVGGATIHTSGNQISTQIAGVSGVDATHPKITCYRGATNDAINLTAVATVFASLQADIVSILAVSDHVIVGTMPTLDIDNGGTYAGDAARVAWVDDWNALVATFPAVMTATDAAYADRVHIVDEFAAFGGHNPPAGSNAYNLYLTTDFHPNGWGHWKQGELYAKKAAELLG